MTTLFLADATDYTPADLAQVVAEQLAEPYRQSDNLRTSLMYMPLTVTAGEYVQACVTNGIRRNTAYNRFNETRKWQRSMGEVA